MAECERCCAKPCPTVSWLPKMIQRRELNGSNMSRFTRLIAEGTLRGVQKEPSYVHRVSFIYSLLESFSLTKVNIYCKSFKYNEKT